MNRVSVPPIESVTQQHISEAVISWTYQSVRGVLSRVPQIPPPHYSTRPVTSSVSLTARQACRGIPIHATLQVTDRMTIRMSLNGTSHKAKTLTMIPLLYLGAVLSSSIGASLFTRVHR